MTYPALGKGYCY